MGKPVVSADCFVWPKSKGKLCITIRRQQKRDLFYFYKEYTCKHNIVQKVIDS